MRRSFPAWWAAIAVGPLALLCGFLPQQGARAGHARERAVLPDVIFTAAPVYESLAALHGGERFPKGAQLMAVRGGRVEPLAPALAASADASVSFDGKTVLFAGKKTAGDPWQIWEMPVSGGEPRLVIGGTTDLIRPLWMPGDRFVFARKAPGGFQMEAAPIEDLASTRLSYGPGNSIPDDVLRDGRVLFEAGYPLGAGDSPELYLVYADGSGVESVRCDHSAGSAGGGRAHGKQMTSGDVVFTQGGRLARFTSALAHEDAVTAPAGEYAGDVAELPDGRWAVSVRLPGEKRYSLAVWQPGSRLRTRVAQDANRELVEPVIVAPRAVPNRHPSALHDWTTGNLLALDARQSREGAVVGTPAAVRVETADESGRIVATGTAPVEKDGSFFVQAMGDRPLRFVLLDAQGRTLRAEHGWFWVRKGEQRICVGCHTGPERAPENRVPEVLLHATTPVDVTGRAAAPAAGGH